MNNQPKHERRKQDTTEKVAHTLGHAGLDEFIQYLRSPWQIIWANFLAGIFRGLGFIIGVTVVLAIVVWILVKVLGGLPIVGEWFAQAGYFIENIQNAAQNLGSIGR